MARSKRPSRTRSGASSSSGSSGRGRSKQKPPATPIGSLFPETRQIPAGLGRAKQAPAAPARRAPARAAARGDAPSVPAPPARPIDDAVLLDEIEFHRHAFVLVPPHGSGELSERYATVLLPSSYTKAPQASCTCADFAASKHACMHVARLRTLHEGLVQRTGTSDIHADFQKSLWARLLLPFADHDEAPLTAMRPDPSDRVMRVVDKGGAIKAAWPASTIGAERLLQRLFGSSWRVSPQPRAAFLTGLVGVTETVYESELRRHGQRTLGQVTEDSLWHRLAYHLYRELSPADAVIESRVEPETGALTLLVHARRSALGPGNDARSERVPLMRIAVPRPAVRRVYAELRTAPASAGGVPLLPMPLTPLVRVTPRTEGGVHVEPVLHLGHNPASPEGSESSPSGSPEGNEANEDSPVAALEDRFRYGDMAYLPAKNAMVEVEPPGPVAKALALRGPRDLDGDEIPTLLAPLAEAERRGKSDVVGLSLLRSVGSISIDARALSRDWCWLSMRYGEGSAEVSLTDLLRAKRRGQRFVPTAAGWLDLESAAFAALGLIADHDLEGEGGELRLSRMELLRVVMASGDDVPIHYTGDSAAEIERLLTITPARALAPLRGLGSTLRDYQERGVTWLLYLYDNRLGGLLCDDMGLGKTHQVMAFMLALREQREVTGPMLVVCPTTVLSHWHRVLATFAPSLPTAVLHGGSRDLKTALSRATVLLTSYGIIRNDIDALAEVEFALVVFDEAQFLKNPGTLAYNAAVRIRADMRLGLSGTPIENTLMDLKALLDLSVPGYLGSEAIFRARYADPIEQRGDDDARAALRRLVGPFVLRRTKRTVLDQLPPKIEDLRTCKLSDEQIRLYRDAVETRGEALRRALADPDQAVPYIHIFSLLTLLKQICCHPALVAGKPLQYEEYQSGKWDLFCELMDECLSSGHKVVVYSQFLGMIDIFARHLTGRSVGVATLTGQTRDRGAVIERFAKDPDCRVFLASLQAGGVGIDLVSASVVIHYDRWWNAAREDQATDRVHRLGQTRGVHVLKLVTEGTLEEKIAAIIDRKRDLMESVVTEDDTGVVKTLSREELLSLLDLASV